MEELTFELKPEGYKTIHQWKNEGMDILSRAVPKKYIATTKNGGPALKDYRNPPTIKNMNIYEYISPDDVVPAKKKRAPFSFSNIEGKHIVFLDTETTGKKKYDKILQITIMDKDGELLNTYVRPKGRKTWTEASNVNHIYFEDVEKAPSTEEVAVKVREILSNADVVVGHNISFDKRFIENDMHVFFGGLEIADTCSLFKKEFPESTHKLIDAVKQYCPEFLTEFLENAHKSDTDTKATMKVFYKMAERAKVAQKEPEEISETKEVFAQEQEDIEFC